MSSIKRTGLHIIISEETEALLMRISHLTFATHDDILNLGCKSYLNLHEKQLLKGTANELSGSQAQVVNCVLEDRNDERNVVPLFTG